MSPRRCGGCGLEEIRTITNGRESVNLDPFTGYCVTCLGAAAKEARQSPPESALPFDAKAAAAGKDD